MERRLLYPLLIAAAGLAVYANSFSCPLIFDDFTHIVQDGKLASPLPDLLRKDARPPVALSLWLNHRLGGLDVRGYHAVNLGVHILAGWVLFGLVRRTLLLPPLQARYGARSAGPAAVIALLWVLHPLQTQSVTYVIQRAESMMGLFYLLTLYALLRSASSARPRAWQAASLLFCALGMATKSVMVTAPVMALLYDRVFLAGSRREALRRRGPLYAGFFATTLIPALIFAGRPEAYGPEVGFSVPGVPPLSYALTQPGVILHYLRLSVWPHPLALDYGWPLARTAGEVLLPLAAVGTLLAATLWALRSRPAAGFLGAWFFLTLAPTSSFIPLLDPAFEYRMYLALAAVIAGAVLGAQSLFMRYPVPIGGAGINPGTASGRYSSPVFVRPRRGQYLPTVVLIAAAISLGVTTFRRNQDYRSVLSIWEDTVRKRPLNSRAHSNHGAALHLEGRVEEAIAEYKQALRLEPGYADGHNQLAHALEAQGRHEEAAAEFEETLRLLPTHPRAKRSLAGVLRNRGLVLQAEGKTEEALTAYRRALELDPEDAGTHNNVGALAFRDKRWDEAEGWFRKAVRIDPRNAEAHNNLGAALEMQGKLAETLPHYHRALEIHPGYASAQANLERVRARLASGRPETTRP